MTGPRVLIVEDDPQLRVVLPPPPHAHGFHPEAASPPPARPGGAGVDGAVEAAGIRLDPVGHAVARGDAVVSLTPTEFRLLARLLAHPGEAVRRRELVRAAWPHGAIVRENTLDVYV